ncbi:MAG TPA: sucrose synthase [Candidatus Aminicenantes bacterium]|nr:sucrose synthase [Candidatus Aminicenantes bacterium]
MSNLIPQLIPRREQQEFREFMSMILADQPDFLHQNDIMLRYFQFCDETNAGRSKRRDSTFFAFLCNIQELFLLGEYLFIMHRPETARFHYYRVNANGSYMEAITTGEYLQQKDRFAGHSPDPNPLRIDFQPFYDFAPRVRHFRNIGNGILFLNRYLSSHMFQNPDEWNRKLFEFLKLHQHDGRQLLVNGSSIPDMNTLIQRLRFTTQWLKQADKDTPIKQVERRLKRSGLEPGWGDTVERAAESMQSLIDLFDAPDDSLLESFISRVPMPMISRIAVVSPHGWFGQNNVLGRPDTGGQVIYILDQVRALEAHLRERLSQSGLDVTPRIVVLTRLIPDAGDSGCDVKREHIYRTENSWILRVPFQDEQMNVLPQWVSRFKVWPYLERFANAAAVELAAEFGGRPDLVIGNYSDGNLVSSLLADHFNIIQCTISHALEKTKYPDADLKWRKYEKDYHFSQQFMADIHSMNKSDFIITSTREEIVGSDSHMGQYESYLNFTMPGYIQVLSGIDLFSPKFNVIPPGVSFDLYFPHSETKRRVKRQTARLEERLFSSKDKDIFGTLKDPGKPPIFTMARFDPIKNITGLIDAFGRSKDLRRQCNLVFSAGSIDPELSGDREEQNEIRRAHELIEQHGLDGSVRWLPSISKSDTGEVYRIMADRKGIFVQPARFEAFGLTILEAMVSGLPTFGPKFGGPSEIIDHGRNGFLLNTGDPSLIANSLEHFFKKLASDAELWQLISVAGIRRVHEDFSWTTYSERLLKLAKIYGFWRFAESVEGKQKMDRYSEFIYHFLLRGKKIDTAGKPG